MKSQYRSEYDPNILEKIWILIVDNLHGLWLVLVNGLPFLLDVLYTNFIQKEDERLPDNIGSLLDPKVFSRLSGRPVTKVEYSVRLEQHANSTERAWFKVQYEGEKEETYVFAKVHARTLLVRSLMCMFDVYRNEIHTYSCVKMPVLVPKTHIAKWTQSRFCLAMDDLRKEEVEFPNIWETKVTKDLAKQVLATLAKIHAKFWGNVPHGAWDDGNRPYQGKGMGFFTLYNVRKSCPGLIDDDIDAVFKAALWRWDKVREFYSRPGPKTMNHGDSHMGNFFITKDKQVGTFDFQVKSEEHPMRDVTYFLACSYPEEKLAEDEKELIEYYLGQLEANGVPNGEVPSYEECWLQYRMWGFYTLYAFVFSGGFSDLMDNTQTKVGCTRICAQMKRVNAAGAFYDLMDGKI